METSRAPDYAEPIEGWRLWILTEQAGRILLRSCVKNVVWKPRAALEAECLRYGRRLARKLLRRDHAPPQFDCMCGIYAGNAAVLPEYWREPVSESVSRARVFGRVSLWGTVVECERGWRATRAYPSHIYVPADAELGKAGGREIASRLRVYEVPVEPLGFSSLEAVEAVRAG